MKRELLAAARCYTASVDTPPAPVTLPLPARREYLTSEAALRGLRCAEARYPAGMRIPEHVHERPSITVVTAGALIERRRRGRGHDAVDFVEGWLVTRPRGAPHANDVGAAGVTNVEIEIDPELLRDSELAISASVAARPDLGRLAARLGRELVARDRAHTLIVEGLALEILGSCLRAARAPDRRPPRWLARIYDRIVAEPRADITVGALARDAGTHPVYLARMFRAHYGCSPGELLRTQRLAWAAAALARDDGRTISSIAAEAGFYDESHFARAFRAAHGAAPGSVRRRRARGRR